VAHSCNTNTGGQAHHDARGFFMASHTCSDLWFNYRTMAKHNGLPLENLQGLQQAFVMSLHILKFIC
jgi:hypothetical protein